MPSPATTSRPEFESAQNKMQSWIAIQDRRIEKFMQLADQFTDILAPENFGGKEKHETHVQLFRDLRSMLLLARSDSEKRRLSHELSDLVSLAQQEVSGAVAIAQTMPPYSIPAEYAFEAEIALKDLTEAKRKKSSIKAVEEFFNVNERVIQSLVTFKAMLEMLSKEFHEFQCPEIERYLIQLDEVLQAYQDLRLMDCVMLSDSPAAVVFALEKKISSAEFQKFMFCLNQVALSQETISQRVMPYEKKVKGVMSKHELGKDYLGSLSAYSLIPVQHFPRLPLLMVELGSQFAKEALLDNPDESLLLAIPDVEKIKMHFQEISSHFNEQVRERDHRKAACVAQVESKMLKKSPVECRVIALKSILALHLNNPLEQSGANEVVFFDAYLKNMLARAYPKDFSIERSLFSINPAGPLFKDKTKSQMVFDALGIVDPKNIVFNVDQFDPKKLDELFKLDKNPLWLVLKSTIPVSERFTPREKISTYIELAQAFYHKKIGETEKYLGAFEMAKAAYAVELTDPEVIKLRDEAFQPLFSDVHYRRLAEEGKLGDWIVMKHELHAKPQDRLDVKREISERLTSLGRKRESSPNGDHIPTAAEQRPASHRLSTSESLSETSKQVARSSSEAKVSRGGFFSRPKPNKVAPVPLEKSDTKEAWPEGPSKK